MLSVGEQESQRIYRRLSQSTIDFIALKSKISFAPNQEQNLIIDPSLLTLIDFQLVLL